MLSAHARFHRRSVAFELDVVLEKGFRLQSIRRAGLVWDTRLAPPNPARGDRQVLYFVLEGTLEWHGPDGFLLLGPSAFTCSSGHLEGRDGRWLRTFRSTGESFVAVELHVDGALTQGSDQPRALALSEGLFRAAASYAEVVHTVNASTRAREIAAATLLRALFEEDVLSADLTASLDLTDPVERLLWRALAPLIEQLELLPSLSRLTATTGLTLRQLGRQLDRFVAGFPLPLGGWRDLTRGYRLSHAVLLLSSIELTPAEVASRCGYSGPEALTRALTTEGLPPPMELRRRLLANTG